MKPDYEVESRKVIVWQNGLSSIPEAIARNWAFQAIVEIGKHVIVNWANFFPDYFYNPDIKKEYVQIDQVTLAS